MTRQRVVIAALTFKRPSGLIALIDSLRLVRVPENVDTALLIVDNDPNESARAVVDGVDDFPWEITYVVEARRGIPAARNRALQVSAHQKATHVAWIDDDETAVPEWLSEMFRIMDATGADAVIGPIVPALPPETPQWIAQGRFFDKPTHSDGESIDYGRTSSALVRMVMIERSGLTFDESLVLTGGSDTVFFKALLAAGGKIAWASGAVVYDHLPPSRVTPRWILRRALRVGITAGTASRRVSPTAVGVTRRAATGIAWVCIGLLSLTPLFLLRGRAGVLRSAQHIAKGIGMLAGLCGYSIDEYAQTHGG